MNTLDKPLPTIEYIVAYNTKHGVMVFKVPNITSLNDVDRFCFKNYKDVSLIRCMPAKYNLYTTFVTMH